jgi:hypothetical protein
MDLIIELRISNISDWAIIQPLLKRLKIAFTQKSETAIPEPSSQMLTDVEKESLIQSMNGGFVWSQYDAHEAADILSEILKKETNAQ